MKKLLLFAVVIAFLTACNTDARRLNERNENLKLAITKYIKAVGKDSIRIDSLVLLKVDTLTESLNLLSDAAEWDDYYLRRKQLDSLNRELIDNSLDMAKTYNTISHTMALEQLEDVKKKRDHWLLRSMETLKINDRINALYKRADSVKKVKSNLGYYVKYRLVLTDPKNIEFKLTRLVRISPAYSIIKTDIPDDLRTY